MPNFSNKIDNYSISDSSVSAKLFGFNINSAELDPAHKLWLDGHVLPLLLSGGSITLVGEASRTGTDLHNEKLSKKRATSVVTYLRQTTGKSFTNRITSVGVGEDLARKSGQGPKQENATHRAVTLAAWNMRLPPPTPKPVQFPVHFPVKKIKKVISRTHYVINHPSMDRNTIHDGSSGEAAAALVNELMGKKWKTVKGFITHDHAVNFVSETFTLEETKSVAGTTSEYTTKFIYEYSTPMKMQVPLIKTYIEIVNGKIVKSETTKNYYSRKKIWKKTRPPSDAYK